MSEWIEWKGGECPVPGDSVVTARLRDGSLEASKAKNFPWQHSADGQFDDVVAYRVDKMGRAEFPDPHRDLRERLLVAAMGGQIASDAVKICGSDRHAGEALVHMVNAAVEALNKGDKL